MRNKSETVDEDPLDREIDFSKGRPNPYWLGVVDRRCVRLIDPSLVDLFPDDESVNRALRGVANVAKRSAATAVAKHPRGKKARS
jgi:hypothetical protein